MRIIIVMSLLFSLTVVKAQTIVPLSPANYSQNAGFVNVVHTYNTLSSRKWLVSMYRGISTGVSFFNRGRATTVAAPIGLQLNHRLNNNVYAFANVTVAPAYISFNRSFITTGDNKTFGYNMPVQNGLDMYPAVSLGLMYVNDQKTFSISGSISAERSSYPLLPYYPAGNSRQSTAILSPGK